MKYIYTYQTEREQLDAMKNMNDDEPIVSGNLETNKILISKNASNNRKYRYVNDNNDIIDKYVDVDINYFSELNIVPNDCNKIAIINNETKEILKYDKFNVKYQKNQKPLYSVGLMSDIHYNDIDDSDEDPITYTNDDSEYSEDLRNALKYFSNNVDFVCCSGDISTDDKLHLTNYRRCVSTYGNNLPIYVCSGNHDTAPKYYYKDYWKETAIQNNIFDIHYSENDERTSYYFIKELQSGKKDVYIFLDVEYGNGGDGYYHTHIPRILREDELLIHKNVAEYDFHLYNPNTLIWLSNLLEEHKNDRCFIFTHLMFDEYAGTYHGDDYMNYSNLQVDIIKRHYDQGEFLYNLLEKYSNNYWFSGHSHYKWSWHKIDNKINVAKTLNGSYTIHIPSLARPITYGTTYYSVNLHESEAGIIDIYDDYIILNGLVMKDKLYDTCEQPNDDEYLDVTADMFVNKDNSYVEQYDDYILATLNDTSNIYFNPNNIINSSNCNNANVYIKFEELYCWDDDSRIDLTNEILAEQRIGFRNIINSSIYTYTLTDNHLFELYPNGIIFKKSSASQFINDSIKIQMKIKYCIKFGDNYINKYLPVAIYKLETIN